MKILKKLGAIMAVSLAIMIAIPSVLPVMDTTVEAAKPVLVDKMKRSLEIDMDLGEISRPLKIQSAKSKVKWVVKDESIATVDKNGAITAVKTGKTTISTTVGKKKYTGSIEVKAPVFSSRLHYLFLDEQLKIEIKKCKAPITWESQDDTIATVEVDGTITGKSVGKTNINAIINDTKYPYVITVEDPKILPSLTVTRGKEYDLDLSTIITGTERKDIWWSSEERNVYLIDGLLTPRDPGTDVITAHFGVGSGGRTLSCNVTIY